MIGNGFGIGLLGIPTFYRNLLQNRWDGMRAKKPAENLPNRLLMRSNEVFGRDGRWHCICETEKENLRLTSRVNAVIDGRLSKEKKQWLLGGRISGFIIALCEQKKPSAVTILTG